MDLPASYNNTMGLFDSEYTIKLPGPFQKQTNFMRYVDFAESLCTYTLYMRIMDWITYLKTRMFCVTNRLRVIISRGENYYFRNSTVKQNVPKYIYWYKLTPLLKKRKK